MDNFFLFIFFCFFVSLRCISLFVFLDFIFHIFYSELGMQSWKHSPFLSLELEAFLRLDLRNAHLSKKCLQPKTFEYIIQLQYYKKKCRSEQIVWWAWRASQLIIWKSGSSLIFLQLWSPQIDHDHKLGQIWKITSTNWTKSRQYKASLIETF